MEEEDVGETWCSVGFAGRKPGSLGDVERKLRVALDRRRRTVAEEFTGEERNSRARNGGGGGVSGLSEETERKEWTRHAREGMEWLCCALCSVEWLHAEWAGELAEAARGRRNARVQWMRCPRAEGEATAATIGREGAAE